MQPAPHPETLHTLIALAAVTFASLAGMASFALGRRLAMALPYLLSAAAGALLGTAVAHLLPEAIREIGAGREFTLFLLTGLLGSFLLERSLSVVFQKPSGKIKSDDASSFEAGNIPHHLHEHDYRSGRPLAANILFGGAAHSVIDGIAIATGFSVGHEVGLATTIAVLLHEVPHHIADVGVLIYTGIEKRCAVLLNLLATFGCAAGGIIVLSLGSRIESIVPALLPITAANFLYVALAILLPELQREKDGRRSAIQGLCLLGSVALMCALSQYVRN
jgi:zinc and cadmium transporter